MTLPLISEEQKKVIDSLKSSNVVVDSVAGSGKTTTNLYIAKYNLDKNILLLTYNSKLKTETRQKVQHLGLENLETHSYHSFCVNYYDNECYTDQPIRNLIKLNRSPKKHYSYDIIICDESQDINPLFYNLIKKIFNDNRKKGARLCIVGDKNQSIYDFNQADQRFIVYAKDLFNFNNVPWELCNLSTSFRITHEMANFINRCLLGENRLSSEKITNTKPRYIMCDCFGDYGTNRALEEVKYYLDSGYLPEDIFVLAPSLKSVKSPARILENLIKKQLSINVYVPGDDTAKLDEEILAGKLVFSTFHQAKGLERKVVIIFNFDNSYFIYYKKDADPLYCPNEVYVSSTRSLEHLSLLHHYENDYMPFVNNELLNTYCEVIVETEMNIKKPPPEKPISVSVTELIKHLPSDVINDCALYYEYEKLQDPLSIIDIPMKIRGETSENVSDITGVAIPAILELKLKKTISIFERLKAENFVTKTINKKSDCIIDDGSPEYAHDKYPSLDDIDLSKITSSQILYISNLWNAFQTGYINRVYQIKKYDWLSDDNKTACLQNIEELNISPTSEFEAPYTKFCSLGEKLFKISGSFDCIDNDIVYEFKCTKTLNVEHYTQLAIYMYLCESYKKEQIIEKYIDDANKELFRLKSEFKEMLTKAARAQQANNALINHNSKQSNGSQKFSVGDRIKDNKTNLELGTIVKIDKKSSYIKVKSIKTNKNVEVLGSLYSLIEASNICYSNDILLSEKKKLSEAVVECEMAIENIDSAINRNEEEAHKKMDHIDLDTGNTQYILYNILTKEKVRIFSDKVKLDRMIKHILVNKYFSRKSVSDSDFIKGILQNKL